MIFTQEETEVLARWAKNLAAASRGNNTPVLPRSELELLRDIYARVTKHPAPKPSGCSCHIRDMKARLWKWYKDDLAEREAGKGKAVAAAEEVARMADEAPKKRTTKAKKEDKA